MTGLHVTYPMAKAALEAAVKARGADFIYRGPNDSPNCYYVHMDDNDELVPGCGVGWALNYLGVPLDRFEEVEHIGVHVGSEVPKILGITISDDASRLFSKFQEEQDEQVTWGESLEQALGYTENYGYTED